MRKFLYSATMLCGAVAAGVCFVSVPALADPSPISPNQWYSGQFGTIVNTPVFAPGAGYGTDGPLLDGGTGTAISPGVGSTSWSITMPDDGFITFTDLQQSGDQFAVTVNGDPGDPADSPLVPPGQSALDGGDTSVPTTGHSACSSDISACLTDPFYSSGTFLLPAGPDVISAEFVGGLGNGFVDFYANVPEPASMTVLAAGVIGLGIVRRRSRSAAGSRSANSPSHGR